MNRFLRMITLAALVIAVAGVPLAAANPVSKQYDGPQVKGQTTTVTKTTKTTKTTQTSQTSQPAASPVSTTPTGTLPFTGLDLGVFLVIGGIAVAGGLGLRRVASRRPDGK